MSDITVEKSAAVFIIDDDESVRDSLRMLLSSIGLKAKSYASASDFLDNYSAEMRGCIVSDVRMPGLSGLALQQELITRNSTLPIIFITGHGDIPMAVEAVKAGATDFHTKPFRDQALLDSINTALEQNRKATKSIDKRRSIERRLSSLTQRERQVLDLVVEGNPNKTIAEILHLSTRTVEVHRSHMMEKMEAGSLAELIKLF